MTRNASTAAVIVSSQDLAELEGTLAVLVDPEALADITGGGRVVRLR